MFRILRVNVRVDVRGGNDRASVGVKREKERQSERKTDREGGRKKKQKRGKETDERERLKKGSESILI